MSPLVIASTTTTPQGKHRPTSPLETGEGYGARLLEPPGEALEHQILDVALAMTTEDHELPDWMFANTTGSLGDLQNRRAYYRVDPSARLFYLRLPSGRGKANWVDVAEPRTPFSPISVLLPTRAVRVKPPVVGSESILPDRAHPLPQGATGVDVYNSPQEVYLLGRLNAAFVEAVDEVFADGMESAFSRKLRWIIRTHGDVAIHAIDRVMEFEQVNVEVAGEVLRQVGSIADPQTRHSRLILLLRKLESTDPRIRDAASIGIAAMDNPVASESIRAAVERERSTVLKRNLQLVLDQLQATQQ